MYEVDYTKRSKFPGAPDSSTGLNSKSYSFTGGYAKPESTAKDEEPDFYNNKHTGYDSMLKSEINSAYGVMHNPLSNPSLYMMTMYSMPGATVCEMLHIGSVSYPILNDLRKIIDVFMCGSIDEILKYNIEDAARNNITLTNIGKLFTFMIDVIQKETLLIKMRSNKAKDEEEAMQYEYHVWDLAMHYIESCRNVAVYMMDHFSPHQYGCDLELPNSVCEDIIYIAKIDLGDIAIEDAPKLDLYKTIEILCCNNITFQRSVINEINRYCTDET